MRCFVCIFFTIFAVSGFATTSLEFKKDCDCKVNFEAEATPGFLRISGEGGKILGKLKESKGKVSGELTVSLDDFKTGISLRDSHMKEKYLEVKKYPQAKLKLKGIDSSDGDHEFSADLTLHGKTNPIKGKYTLKTDGKKRSLRAEFSIIVTDFNIPVPSYQVLTVAKEVKVIIDAVAQ